MAAGLVLDINKINIKYANVQNWTTEKAHTLACHLSEGKPEIILITSTSRKNDHAKIKILGYNIHSTNKFNELHAGVAIGIKHGIKYELLNNFNSDTIGAKIETLTGPLNVLTNYTPPRRRYLPNTDLQFAIRHNLPTIIFADLNARHTTFGYRDNHNDKGKELHRLVYRNKINYIGPTFDTYFHNNGSSKPDCVLTNNKFFHNYNIQPNGLTITDHITMLATISAEPILTRCPQFESVAQTNWSKFKDLLKDIPEINIEGLPREKIYENLDTIYEQIENARKESTPIIHVRRQNNLQKTNKFKRLTKILDYYARQIRLHGKTPYLTTVIRNTQNSLIDEGNAMKYIWWENQLLKIEKASKSNTIFWKQVKLAKGETRPKIPDLTIENEDGSEDIAKTNQQKIHEFTKIWSQIYILTEHENNRYCRETQNNVETRLAATDLNPERVINLHNQEEQITIADIRMAIKQSKNKAPGPSKLRKIHFENMPPNILKNIAHILNCSQACGYYPKKLKIANIIMIPKPNTQHSDAKNYRPISLLNFMSKIYSRIINNKLKEFLEENNIIRDTQFGFRRKRGTASLLTQLYELISRTKCNKKTLVTIVSRDVSKAFDKIWRKGLVFKLIEMGLPNKIIKILNSYLTDRYAAITINKDRGEEFKLETGVPQGDVLSATLYIIMVNDLPSPTRRGNNQNYILQYADDTTQIIITRFNVNIRPRHKLIHNENVKNEIIKQNQYEQKWKISTNLKKIELLAIGNRIMPSIDINGEITHYKQKIKLLGMWIKYNNFFAEQVKCNAGRANEELQKIRRFRYLKKKLKVRLYKTLVLPHLTNPAAPLNMISNAQMKILQTVQNKAIRWICQNYRGCNIEEQEQRLKIEPIKDRIKRLAEGIWNKLEEIDTEMLQNTLEIDYNNHHSWFRSSYASTFDN